MDKKYRITTLKDIFDTVPVEKIPECLNELGVMMVQQKHMNEAMCLVVEAAVGEKPQKAFDWPESITWIDDDMGEIKCNYVTTEGGEPFLTTKMVVDK